MSNAAKALYLRTHLLGASGGVQLARLVAADPWTAGALDHLPGELEKEMAFVRARLQAISGRRERWLPALVGVGSTVRSGLGILGVTRGQYRRVAALETMRSLLLAKKAMWELGENQQLDLGPDTARYCAQYDQQAVRQAAELQSLHKKAAAAAFGSR